MKLRRRNSSHLFCFAASLVCGAWTVVVNRPANADDSSSSATGTDRAFTQALGKSNKTAVGQFLDADFEWTDADGKTLGKAAALENLQSLAADNRDDADVKAYNYVTIGVIVGRHHNARFMRVWVKHSPGWRALAFIDTPIGTGAAPFSTPTGDALKECENPCRSIPYLPASDVDKTILATFQRLKVDEWHPNPEGWAPYVVDGVDYVTSATALSKADRIAHLTQQKESGAAILPGDPVISMRILDFGGAALMAAKHAPYRGGKPYYSLRVWTFRDGR